MSESDNIFYAVRVGRHPGVYRSWEQCQTQVFKYPKAEHESFATEQQAWAYIRGDGMTYINLSANSGKQGSPRAASTGEPPITQGWTVVYTDGACSDNQDAAKARAGVGVWWANDDPRNLSERCPGAQTNNRAELLAIGRALEQSRDIDNLDLRTDSKYAIQCCETWVHNWVRNGWKTAKGADVINKSLIRYLVALLEERIAMGLKYQLVHVRGHQGIYGNEQADRLAVAGTHKPSEPERDWDALARVLSARASALRLRGTAKVGTTVNDDMDIDLMPPPPLPPLSPARSQSLAWPGVSAPSTRAPSVVSQPVPSTTHLVPDADRHETLKNDVRMWQALLPAEPPIASAVEPNLSDPRYASRERDSSRDGASPAAAPRKANVVASATVTIRQTVGVRTGAAIPPEAGPSKSAKDVGVHDVASPLRPAYSARHVSSLQTSETSAPGDAQASSSPASVTAASRVPGTSSIETRKQRPVYAVAAPQACEFDLEPGLLWTNEELLELARGSWQS